jgi:putative nucleotidyltransferase with HDIG domain
VVGRDRRASFALAGAFLAVAVPMALLLPSSRTPSPLMVALLVAVYAILSRVEFEVGTGRTMPTQLVLVPMLFVLPAGYVPLAVAAGLVAGHVLDRDGLHLDRVPLFLVSSWHAVGPALVLGWAGDAHLGAWPLYLAALAAQFAFDLVWAWTAYAKLVLGRSPRTGLREQSLVYVVDAALAPLGLMAALAAPRSPHAFLLALPLAALLSVFARERTTRFDHAIELSNAYRGTAFLLGDVVEADDAYTGSHSRDVVQLSLAVADELGLSASDRRDTEFAALLHDVGKVRIPNEIINKPGLLTPEEREIINTHTVVGEAMLEKVGGVLARVGRIVRSCHERWDGSGYPDGLTGEEIPLVARIVCACDAFNAMTTDRPYRAARSTEEALTELRSCSGTHFDPTVVDALARVAEHGAAG